MINLQGWEWVVVLTGMLVFLVLIVALFIAALVSIAQRESASGTEKALWIAIALFFPVLGPILWFVIGKKSTRGAYR